MSQAFIGQIQPFGFNFAPRNWAQCNGQIMSIAQNNALFSLLGTTYGGDGQTTFALPNLQSRVPMHSGTFAGTSYAQGTMAGEEQVTVNLTGLPAHTHTFLGSSANADSLPPADGAVLAKSAGGGGTPDFFYGPDAAPQPLSAASIAPAGGNLPHSNLQPYLTINWCICLFGIFPSRN